MANNISALMPDIYEALDIVSRELTGMIPSVTMNASAERAGMNQAIRVDVEPANTLQNIVPSMTPPTAADQTSGFVDIKLTNQKSSSFNFNGDELKILNTGIGYQNVRAMKIAQSIRAIVNLSLIHI